MNIVDLYKVCLAKLSRSFRRSRRQRHASEGLVRTAFHELLNYMETDEKVARPETLLIRTVLEQSTDSGRVENRYLLDNRTAGDLPAAIALTADHEYDPAQSNYLECIEKSLDETVGIRAREVFYLICYGQLSYDEIAEQLSMSVADVTTDLAKVLCVLSLMKQDRKPE